MKLCLLLTDHGGDARELVGLGQRAVLDEGLDRLQLVHVVVEEHALESVVLVDSAVVPVFHGDALQLDPRELPLGRTAHFLDYLGHDLVVPVQLVEARIPTVRAPALVLVGAWSGCRPREAGPGPRAASLVFRWISRAELSTAKQMFISGGGQPEAAALVVLAASLRVNPP
jgi:hypothetical protein